MAGDEVTGATTFLLEEGLDTGPVSARVTETIRPDRHQRRPARPARRRAAPGCWSRPWTASRPGAGRSRRRSPPTASRSRRRSPSRTRGWTGRHPRCGSTGWSGPARRPPAPGPRRAASGSSSARSASCPTTAGLAPGEVAVDQAGVQVGTGADACGSARSSRRASGRCRPPTGPAGSGSSRRERLGRSDAAVPARAAGRAPHGRPARRRARRHRPAAGRVDPPGGPPSTRCARSRARTRTPTWCCPGCCRERGIERPRRRVRHRAGLRHAARARAPTTRCIAACVDRPLRRRSTPPVLDVLRLGAHQLLGMRVPPHAAVGATVDLARAVLGDGRGEVRQRGAAQGRARATWTTWLAEVAPPTTPTRSATWRSCTRTRCGSSRALRGRRSAAAAAGRSRHLLAADNAAARGHPGRPARAGPPRPSCAWRRRRRRAAGRPYAVRAADGGDPAALDGGPRGPGRRPGRGQPAGRARAGRRAARRAATSAGSTCCAGPGGKAALLGGARRARAVRALTADETQPHRAGLVAPALAGSPAPYEVVVGRRRAPAVDGRAPSTGCWSTCPAPGWARCAAGRRRGGGGAPTDVAGLAPLQRALLARGAATRCGPGGVVAYVTCSPHLAETRRGRRRRPRRARRPRAAEPARRPAVLPGVPGARRRAGRPAVAAPARHGRDVPRPAPPSLTRHGRWPCDAERGTSG